MSDNASCEAERLILAAGRCPQLSSGLRERIIGESVRARGRVERRLRWDHTLAFCGLLVWLGIFIRQQAMFPIEFPRKSDFQSRLVTVAEFTKKSFSARSDSSVAALAAVDRHPEWAHVEMATRLRAIQRRVLRRCLGS